MQLLSYSFIYNACKAALQQDKYGKRYINKWKWPEKNMKVKVELYRRILVHVYRSGTQFTPHRQI